MKCFSGMLSQIYPKCHGQGTDRRLSLKVPLGVWWGVEGQF